MLAGALVDEIEQSEKILRCFAFALNHWRHQAKSGQPDVALGLEQTAREVEAFADEQAAWANTLRNELGLPKDLKGTVSEGDKACDTGR